MRIFCNNEKYVRPMLAHARIIYYGLQTTLKVSQENEVNVEDYYLL